MLTIVPRNDLGPHILNFPGSFDTGVALRKTAEWQPGIQKLVDCNAELVFDFCQAAPNALVMLRNVPRSEQKGDMYNDPIETGIRHTREWRAELDAIRAYFHLRGVAYPGDHNFICLSINEPGVKERDERLDVAEYNRAGMTESNHLGIRWGAFNFSVSWPGGTREPAIAAHWNDFASCVALLQVPDRHVYVANEYWGIEGPDVYWGGFAGRIVRCPWPGVTFAIGECSIDNVHDHPWKRGWLDYLDEGMTAELLARMMMGYVGRLRQALGSRFLGATPFSIGGNPAHWLSFQYLPPHNVIDTIIREGGAMPPPPPPPAPPPAGDRNLDPRLTDLGVTITTPALAPGTEYWKAVEVLWQDEAQSGGRHHIYFDMLDQRGNRLVGAQALIGWTGGNVVITTENKPPYEYSGNFAMYAAGCAFSMEGMGLPTEKINCLGLGSIEQRDWTIHTSFLIKWRKVVREGVPPPPPQSQDFANWLAEQGQIVATVPVTEGHVLYDAIRRDDLVPNGPEIWLRYAGSQQPYSGKQYALRSAEGNNSKWTYYVEVPGPGQPWGTARRMDRDDPLLSLLNQELDEALRTETEVGTEEGDA